MNSNINLLFDATFSIGVKMDFSLIVTELLTLIIEIMKKSEQNLIYVIGTIGIGVLLGKSITPIVREVIQRKFILCLIQE